MQLFTNKIGKLILKSFQENKKQRDFKKGGESDTKDQGVAGKAMDTHEQLNHWCQLHEVTQRAIPMNT